jgi:hypothetical protein
VKDVLNGQNNYGFKSGNMAPEIPELVPFEQAIFEMINQLSFRYYHNKFLENLKSDLENIRQDEATKVIVAADKTRNLYKCDADWYRKTLKTEISKDYKGARDSEVLMVNEEAADIAEKLKLEKRMLALTQKGALYHHKRS